MATKYIILRAGAIRAIAFQILSIENNKHNAATSAKPIATEETTQ